ncbi:hypothetical protein [Chamaesiphon polymorphus]|uniref:hypothetical protein n=1 Tax=Chamaesiphon polymorphus TaxID=2107691 RepID=UPI0015E75983|nr:hypothetical protein [Chamaesiphon polymorphus]
MLVITTFILPPLDIILVNPHSVFKNDRQLSTIHYPLHLEACAPPQQRSQK